MQIPKPYLLFLGDVRDALAVKMARGILTWRPEACVGQLRLDDQTPSLGIDDLPLEAGRERGAQTLVVGTANAGGKLPEHWVDTLEQAIELGYNVASGMHQRLAAIPRLADAAKRQGVKLFDIRHDAPALEVGNGKRRSGRRVLSVGLDCAVGKMFSALALEAELKSRGENADFRATGQSGILIQGEGIAVDAVVADFISGAAEYISPANDADHWDLVEGQGSLFHPSYAGVSLGLLHGAQPDFLVMCHELGRPHVRHLPHIQLPSYAACVERNLANARTTNPDVVLAGFSINTSNVDEAQARAHLAEIEAEFGVPATDPVRFGVGPLVDHLIEQTR